MSSTLRIMVIALLLTTAAALGMILYQVANPPRVTSVAQQALPPPLQVSYLVAAHPLPAGTLVRDEDFVHKSVLAGQIPANAMIDTPESRTDLRGALIRTYLDNGAPVSFGDVIRPRDRGFIASVLARGTRAISVGVDPVSGVSGLIWPGDHVDVILTQLMDKEVVSRRVIGETILENVRVIAIDQEIMQGASVGNAAAGKLARTVTLQVTPDQAEKVAVAQNLGKLMLSIRASIDEADQTMAERATTFGADVSPALSRSGEAPGVTMQVIDGDKRKEVTFR